MDDVSGFDIMHNLNLKCIRLISMSVKRFIKLSFVLTLMVSLALCAGPSEITNEIEGSFIFKYPSGKVEILNIKNDFTYSQFIYSNDNDYKSKIKPLYSNYGKWTYTGAQLEFGHWLIYCKFNNPDSILTEPKYGTMLNVYWDAPTNKHKGMITIYDETGYVFEKIE